MNNFRIYLKKKHLNFKFFRYKIHNLMLTAYDRRIDRKICHRSLCKYVPSVFRDDDNAIGSTGSQSTHYLILREIFSNVNLTENDHFIDIGCGKGRVLAYLIKENAPCCLNGVEINEIPGNTAREWTKDYNNINIIIGDAFKINLNDYNVFFLGRPFLPNTFLEFLEKLEKDVTHPVTFIYWVDQQSGHYLKDREGWTLQYREKLQKIDKYIIFPIPLGFSIWNYNPEK